MDETGPERLDSTFRDDAARLSAALHLVINAYVRTNVAYPDTATRDYERARAAFEAGKALGEHDKLIGGEHA